MNCTFVACSFDQLEVNGGDWSLTGMPGADLRKTRFRGVRMREIDLVGANCEGGALTDCDLSGAWAHEAKFDRCDLRDSDISSIDPWNASLRGAIITWNQAAVIATSMGLIVDLE